MPSIGATSAVETLVLLLYTPVLLVRVVGRRTGLTKPWPDAVERMALHSTAHPCEKMSCVVQGAKATFVRVLLLRGRMQVSATA